MNMNVFHFTRPVRYYLAHPMKFFSDAGKMLRSAKQRTVRGWCDMDAWEMNSWFLEVVPQMMRKLATDGCGYPGCGKWESPGKWNSYLFCMADKFSSLTEDSMDARNKYHQEYLDLLDKTETLDELVSSELSKDYFAECIRIQEESKQTKQEAFSMMCECFDALWD